MGENPELDKFLVDVDEVVDDQPPEGAAPEAPAESEPPPAEDDKPARQVPIQALDAERSENKRLRDQIEAMNRRFEDVIRKINGDETKAEEVPAWEDRPADHLKYRTDRLEEATRAQTEFINQQRQLHQIQAVVAADEQRFMAEKPDYAEALNFLKASRRAELEAIYPAQHVAAAMAQEELAIIQASLAQGKSPAERAYELARLRGYQPKSAQSDAKKLSSLKSGMDANRSLSSVSGEAGKEAMTLEDLAELTGEEFEKAWDRVIGGNSEVGKAFRH